MKKIHFSSLSFLEMISTGGKTTGSVFKLVVSLFILCMALPAGAQVISKSLIARQLVMAEQADGRPVNEELNTMKVSSETFSRKSGVSHVYFQQFVNDIPVYNAILNAHVTKENKLLTFSSRFVPDAGTKAGKAFSSLTAEQAVETAARQLGYLIGEKLVIQETPGGSVQKVIFAKGKLSSENIPVQLVWQPMEDNLSEKSVINLRLAWDLSIAEPSGKNWWSVRVDAVTGEILSKNNWIIDCNFGENGNECPHQPGAPHSPVHKSTIIGKANNFVIGGGTYNVFPEPLENPYFGGRQLIFDPANAIASPFGWHDIDGVAGAEYTITRGNNVHAYTDADFNNVPDALSSPDGGAGLLFDFPLDLSQHPSTYRPAAVTNLFYWNNYMHDFAYKYGFDELSGNFQVNNYGKGGLGNDDVRAEAQDGPALNNANFGTPPDGSRPRMQMFLGRGTDFFVTSPAAIAKYYTSTESGFSINNKLANVGPVSGQVVYYNDDAGGTTHFACAAPANSISGKIALIDRGGNGAICPSAVQFIVKVKNAQVAGAIAVIVVNNVPGPPAGMGGTDNSIIIPAIMISQSDGAIIAAQLVNNVSVTLAAGGIVDGDFDNGVIAHEYGHGISNRLTGGPAIVNCLQNAEQMGEGWSDFFALMTTMAPGDVGSTPRTEGNYLAGQPTSGPGFRPTPYSTDMTINPSTYNTIKTSAIPHGVGYVWASMLWDMTWALIEAHGRATGFDESMNLVMEGMRLQPCSPGFVNGRDAILAADVALYGGANQCLIWKAFARRGLGLSANQGLSTSVLDGTQEFDLPIDETPPTITSVTPSQVSLWPPNHTMRDITINIVSTDNCSGANSVCSVTSVTSNEPINGTGDGDTSPDWEIIDATHIRLRAERAGNGSGRFYTITVTCTDESGNSSTSSTQVHVAHNITAPVSGNSIKVGSTVSFAGTFQDKPGNRHTGKWLIDGTTSTNATITEPSGNQNGKSTGSYKFNTPGVYKLQMNITDQNGITSYANTNGDLEAIVVIYDPNGGYTYGGGWFPSQAGALVSNPSTTGKASYGFTMNYYKNAANPKGESQFEFKVGTFEFNALNFDYLSIQGAKAQFRGTGKTTINGIVQGGIAFTMTVIDGALDGTGVDKVRMKIFNKTTHVVYYDNMPGASDASNPVTPVGTNSTVVIGGTQGNGPTTKTTTEVVPEEVKIKGLDVSAYPNPTSSGFSIQVNAVNKKERITLQVTDISGRVLEVRENIIPGSSVRIGDGYKPGSYFVRAIQGDKLKAEKLIKILD